MTTHSMSYAQTLAAILRGEVVVYPTETFYAIGCDACDARAVDAVFSIKARDTSKPVPLILGSVEQVYLVAREVPDDVHDLARRFWPGPVTVLLPALSDLPRAVCNEHGEVAVRVTPHPVAQRLCLEANRPLVSTSANLSGKLPASRPQELHEDILSRCSGVLDARPWPGGGMASTLVAVRGPGSLCMLRRGAVSDRVLRDSGFTLVPAGQDGC